MLEMYFLLKKEKLSLAVNDTENRAISFLLSFKKRL